MKTSAEKARNTHNMGTSCCRIRVRTKKVVFDLGKCIMRHDSLRAQPSKASWQAGGQMLLYACKKRERHQKRIWQR